MNYEVTIRASCNSYKKKGLNLVEVIIFVQVIIQFESSITYLHHYPITSARSDSMLTRACVCKPAVQMKGEGSAERLS